MRTPESALALACASGTYLATGVKVRNQGLGAMVDRILEWGRAVLAAMLMGLVHSQVALARDVPVDLELILMVDVSGSVDHEEAQLQRKGYAAALTSPGVIAAIQAGPMGRVALSYVEWADDGFQNQIVGWTLIDGEAAARDFASRLTSAPVSTAFWTSIGAAIDYAAAQFPKNGFEGTRRVIDVSGDGYSNRGRPPREARDDAIAQGITINGLPILNTKPTQWGAKPPLDLDTYYKDQVIGGPGAFVSVAEDYSSFGQAIVSKLVREIAALPVDAAIIPASTQAAPTRASGSARVALP